jgi:DNA-binding protein Fis
MNSKNPAMASDKDIQAMLSSTVEAMIEKKLEDIATVLCKTAQGKSRLHEEVMAMVERSLFKIALMRSNNVKSTAALYLGINRNTFQNKMVKLGLNCSRD